MLNHLDIFALLLKQKSFYYFLDNNETYKILAYNIYISILLHL